MFVSIHYIKLATQAEIISALPHTLLQIYRWNFVCQTTLDPFASFFSCCSVNFPIRCLPFVVCNCSLFTSGKNRNDRKYRLPRVKVRTPTAQHKPPKWHSCASLIWWHEAFDCIYGYDYSVGYFTWEVTEALSLSFSWFILRFSLSFHLNCVTISLHELDITDLVFDDLSTKLLHLHHKSLWKFSFHFVNFVLSITTMAYSCSTMTVVNLKNFPVAVMIQSQDTDYVQARRGRSLSIWIFFVSDATMGRPINGTPYSWTTTTACTRTAGDRRSHT